MGHSAMSVCAFEDSTGDRRTLHSPEQELATNMTTRVVETTEDNDIHKGATENDRPASGSQPSGLGSNGMRTAVAIAQDKLGANEDETQG